MHLSINLTTDFKVDSLTDLSKYKLIEANQKGSLPKLIKQIDKLDLLVLDELGYIPLHKESAELHSKSYPCIMRIKVLSLQPIFSLVNGIMSLEILY